MIRMGKLFFIYFMVFGISTSVYAGGGVDKSGVKPQVIKLPTGPGSIDGLGESFEPQLNTGTANYAVPLSVPPGRGGLTPELILQYNGGNGNGPFGMGWRISVGGVQRQTDKGLPIYNDAKDTFLADSGDELVPIGNGFYRCKTEGAFDQYQKQGSYWVGSKKNGIKSYYGLSDAEQIKHNQYIFGWKISKTIDPNGNEILYRYNEASAFPDGNMPNDGQLYLTSITYNKNIDTGENACISFHYEIRSPSDSLFDYRSRFPVQTTMRCCEIRVSACNLRVRSYHLLYEPGFSPSRLYQVETYGREESLGPLPSVLTLEYTSFQLNHKLSRMDKMGQEKNPAEGLSNPNVDLVDMNGDALPDLLYTGDVHTVYINEDGLAWSSGKRIEGGFSEFTLGDAKKTVLLMDMDGDGYSDLLEQDFSINGYRYFRGGQAKLGWATQSIEITPNSASVFNSNTKPVDLNGDGCIDALSINGDQILCYFNDHGKKWISGFAMDSPYDLQFSSNEYSLQLADMNGDRIQDLVVMYVDGHIRYYPGRGITPDGDTPIECQGWDATPRGPWKSQDGQPTGFIMANPPNRGDDSDLENPAAVKNMYLMDVNGDGLSDIVYIGNNRLRIWLNQGGYSFSHSCPIKNN